MAKKVFERVITLYPRLDSKHPAEAAREVYIDIMHEHPEYEHLHWSMTLKQFADGTADLRITVEDPNTMSFTGLLIGVLLLAVFFWIFYG